MSEVPAGCRLDLRVPQVQVTEDKSRQHYARKCDTIPAFQARTGRVPVAA